MCAFMICVCDVCVFSEKKYGAKFVATMSCAKHHESKFCFHCVVTSASGASKNSNEAVVTVQPS